MTSEIEMGWGGGGGGEEWEAGTSEDIMRVSSYVNQQLFIIRSRPLGFMYFYLDLINVWRNTLISIMYSEREVFSFLFTLLVNHIFNATAEKVCHLSVKYFTRWHAFQHIHGG